MDKYSLNNKLITLIIFGVLIFGFNIGYQKLAAQTKKPLHSHTHGADELNIAIESQTLEIEFSAPSNDIIGFEHAPKTDAEKKTLEQIKALFSKNFEVVTLPKEAKCKALERKVKFEAEDTNKEHHEEGETEVEHEEHSEFEVEITYSCLDIKKLTMIDVQVFKKFPTLQNIHAQIVNEDKQSSESLTPKKTVLKINAAK